MKVIGLLIGAIAFASSTYGVAVAPNMAQPAPAAPHHSGLPDAKHSFARRHEKLHAQDGHKRRRLQEKKQRPANGERKENLLKKAGKFNRRQLKEKNHAAVADEPAKRADKKEHFKAHKFQRRNLKEKKAAAQEGEGNQKAQRKGHKARKLMEGKAKKNKAQRKHRNARKAEQPTEAH